MHRPYPCFKPLVASSLSVWLESPPPTLHTHTHKGKTLCPQPPQKEKQWFFYSKCFCPNTLLLDILSPCCHPFLESGLPQQHTHKLDWVMGLLDLLKFDKPLWFFLFFLLQTSWLACGEERSDLAWANISVNGFNFPFLTFEVFNGPGMTAPPSISTHGSGGSRRSTCKHTKRPAHRMSQSLLFPWCFVLRRYPSRAASLWTPTTSSKRNERSEEGQETRKKERKKGKSGGGGGGEPCFPNHIPMRFQLWRWGRSKQFCLSCLCYVVLSFRGLFCFKLFSLSFFYAEE